MPQTNINLSTVDFHKNPETPTEIKPNYELSSENTMLEPRVASESRIQRKKLLGVQDIDIDALPSGYLGWAFAIKSPRSLSAFKLAGINPKELDPINERALSRKL